MNKNEMLAEYMREIRSEVCGHCVERPADGPPCGPLGKHCGIEAHLDKLVEEVHMIRSARIDPYLDELHRRTCAVCESRDTEECPCPLDYLHVLAVWAIDQVDGRHQQTPPPVAIQRSSSGR
jgi:hypothetical protein